MSTENIEVRGLIPPVRLSDRITLRTIARAIDAYLERIFEAEKPETCTIVWTPSISTIEISCEWPQEEQMAF